MDPIRRENLKTKAQERWADAKEIAPLLEMDKETVHNAHAKIRHLIPRIKGGEVDAIEEAKKIINEKPAIKIHKSIDNRYGKDSRCETPEDKLRLALWFIRKIGDPDEAVEVVKLATQATKKLSEQ